MGSGMRKVVPTGQAAIGISQQSGPSLVEPTFPSFIKNKTHECPGLTCDVLSTTVRAASLSWETTPLFKEALLCDQACFHYAVVSDSFLLCCLNTEWQSTNIMSKNFALAFCKSYIKSVLKNSRMTHSVYTGDSYRVKQCLS